MSSALTVYKNELNAVPFKDFTSVEMDLFFSICSQMRDKGLVEVTFSFDELKLLSKYKATSNKRFLTDLKNTYLKLLNLKYSKNYISKQNNDIEEYFVLFTGFRIDKTNNNISIKVNPDLSNMLNSITGNFTKFDLEEFTELRSIYSKTAFRLLKQFRLTGYWKVTIEDFRELLDVPESYPMSRMTTIVLNPIEKELSPIFPNLEIRKIKSKKSRKIEFLEFVFDSDDDLKLDNSKKFRNKDGEYYSKHLYDFTPDEVQIAFPDRKIK